MHDSNKLVRNGDLIRDRIHCGDLENNSCVHMLCNNGWRGLKLIIIEYVIC